MKFLRTSTPLSRIHTGRDYFDATAITPEGFAAAPAE
jgi:hypothetical protein